MLADVSEFAEGYPQRIAGYKVYPGLFRGMTGAVKKNGRSFFDEGIHHEKQGRTVAGSAAAQDLEITEKKLKKTIDRGQPVVQVWSPSMKASNKKQPANLATLDAPPQNKKMKVKPLAIIAATCALVTASQGATMFGVQFHRPSPDSSPANILSPGETAGLVPQSNFNTFGGNTGTGVALKDELGATTSTLLTYSAKGTFRVNTNTAASPDEKLNQQMINGTNGTQPTFTVNAIPFTLYDLIVYTLNDGNRRQRITLSGIGSFTVNSPSPGAAGYVDGNVNTAYIYTQGTTNNTTPVANSNYVRFTGLIAPSLTITSDARPATFPGTDNDNAFINGFQIVQIPEPTSLSLLGICGTLALLRRRRA